MNKYIKIGCRLCGEVWNMPERYAELFDSDHAFECPDCKRAVRFMRGNSYISDMLG